LFEDSIRISRGETVAEHRDRIAELWSGFSAVASANPYSWDRTAHSAGEIREASSDNRMIAFPYPKALVANNMVDMASAVLLCSVELARSSGVAPDRLVFPQVVTTSSDTAQLTQRHLLHETPALATAGRAALQVAGIGIDEVDHLDLYACFPSIVEMSAASLGVGLDRPLTVTGGLGFAGAPIANSSGQAIAAMVPLVREGGWGLVHANGGSATKHAFGIYRAEPPLQFRRTDCQHAVDHRARAAAPADWSGAGTVEAATVVFEREGPSHLLAAVLTPEDSRALVRTEDADVMETAMTEGLAGTPAPLPGAVRVVFRRPRHLPDRVPGAH
jgi:acetyl-CoA C-acetyltransferase